MFTKSIIEGKKISIYNYGNHRRDFTYIDDIVEGLIRVLDRPAEPNILWDSKILTLDHQERHTVFTT